MRTIVFINTPTQEYPDEGRKDSYTTIPPYGLGYVATAASKAVGRDNVELIDAEYLSLSPEKTAQTTLSLKPEYVGINIFSPTYQIARKVIQQIGQDLGPQRILLGGPHAILHAQQILSDEQNAPFIHFVSTGEGEEVIQKFLMGIPREELSGIAFNTSDREVVIREGKELSAKQLDQLIVDRSLFNNDPNRWTDGTIESYMLSSRGCPFNCEFCVAGAISHQRTRLRSITSLNHELRILQGQGVNYVRFIDDLLLLSKKRVYQLAEMFRDLGLNRANFGFEANGRANIMASFGEEMWETIVHMGLRELEIGIESGSVKVLRAMGRQITPEQVIRTVELAVGRNISVKGFLMVGYPGETKEDLSQTIALAHQLKGIGGEMIRFSPVPVKAYPGTPLYEQVRELKNNHGIEFGEDTVVSVADQLGLPESSLEYQDISRRTRYNAMHTVDGYPIALSELSGGAKTSEVYRALAELMLISSLGSVRSNPEQTSFSRGKEKL